MQPERLREVLRDNIRGRRKELGLSQAAVASAAGITQAYYSLIENGKQTPSIDTLAGLADALNTNPSALLSPENFSAIPVDGP